LAAISLQLDVCDVHGRERFFAFDGRTDENKTPGAVRRGIENAHNNAQGGHDDDGESYCATAAIANVDTITSYAYKYPCRDENYPVLPNLIYCISETNDASRK
jgi:hypothetical protein